MPATRKVFRFGGRDGHLQPQDPTGNPRRPGVTRSGRSVVVMEPQSPAPSVAHLSVAAVVHPSLVNPLHHREHLRLASLRRRATTVAHCLLDDGDFFFFLLFFFNVITCEGFNITLMCLFDLDR
ncbi:hypothetical protein TIFTF001_039257 [Ficus carica]|uniref:Uncharacterized protein n=1 Tax=Ficus carica TaxID=3494 RepID=A0AA88E970_FICCA|nr:hypothetical protein TIFTF001_039257 [Ficus carica]